MKQFGQVLLISCYELGHQPFGIALAAGFLKRAGYFPDTLDLSVQKIDIAKVKRAKWIGISVPMHTALRIGSAAAERIREINPACHISFYGLYSSLNGKALLKGLADSVIGGEYESPLLAWVDKLDRNEKGSIPGVQTREHSSKPLLAHLPFPTPSREHLLPLAEYAHLIDKGESRQVGYVEASRGCRHHCRHCPIPPVYGGRFFILPHEAVLNDIENLVGMGATHITFGDPDFLNGPNHSLRIVRSLHARFRTLTFDFTAKVEHLIKYQAHLPELAHLGCLFVVSAIESMSNTVLKYLDKQHTRADIIQIFQLLRQAGIALRPSLVPFTPWTTLDDLNDLFETIEKEDMIDHVDPVHYTIRLLIPPGSLLLSEPTVTSVLGALDEGAFTYKWTHPEDRIDHLQRRFSSEVEQGIEMGKESEEIFFKLKEYADAARGKRKPGQIQARTRNDRKRPPRLTESWFCCAEPTSNQLRNIEKTSQKSL